VHYETQLDAIERIAVLLGRVSNETECGKRWRKLFLRSVTYSWEQVVHRFYGARERPRILPISCETSMRRARTNRCSAVKWVSTAR